MDRYSLNELNTLVYVILNDKKYFPEYLAISGSNLYGTDTEESDIDSVGYVVPPFNYGLGGKEFTCKQLKTTDAKVYSLAYYLQLIISGDPLLTESLFIPKQLIVKSSSIHEKVLSLKSDLISNNIYNRILGYSRSEWRKAMGLKYVEEPRTKTEEEVIAHIRKTFFLNKEKMDSLISILMEDKESKLVSSIPSVGSRRKEEYEKYGYCVKSASHSIRLVEELYELITTGEMIFPRPNAEYLLDVKKGRIKKEEVDKVYHALVEKTEKVREDSVLPDQPNQKWIWSVCSEITIDCFKKECGF
jgi:hypothetical protein